MPPKIKNLKSKMKRLSLFIMCAYALAMTTNATRYVGGDISMLPKYEQYNSPYLDPTGKNIDDLLLWFHNTCGWNTFRVRIFVNPGTSDPSVCQNLAYVTALGKRIKDAGCYFMLDFHYSDTWVDATHIQAPVAWQGSSAAVMADSLGNYTHRVLQALKAAGATPDLVQVGNEIMYGLCGIKVAPYSQASTDGNWPNYINLVKAGCDAVRAECPDAQIIIHTDRPTNTGYNKYYYDKLVEGGVDFDIIGLSYYPFWHGWLTAEQNSSTNLVRAINTLATQFPNKRVHIVEAAYNFQYWPESANTDTRSVWPCSVAGQYKFVKNLVDALQPLTNVDGLSYWFPEEAGNGDNGSVIPSWLNRGFWNENKSSTGHAINKTTTSTIGQVMKNICAPYYMSNFLAEPSEGLMQTNATTLRNSKFLRNGQLLIERDGKIYNAQGAQIR